MKNRRLLIGLIVLAILAVGGLYGWYLYNKPVQCLEKKKADIVVTAQKLVEDYTTNEQMADSMYLGKIIQVEGTVDAVMSSSEDTKINLQADNPMSLVTCTLEPGKTIGVAVIGTKLTVKGRCSGFLGDVHLDQANVIEPENND